MCWAPDGHPRLTGVDDRPGVELNSKGRRATYYDGEWVPGLGPDQRHDPIGPTHWAGGTHSLVAETPHGTVAVRSTRTAVSDHAELDKILSSITLVSTGIA